MSKEKSAYLVVGSTGEYSDHRHWYVRAFLEKAPAEALVKRLTSWMNEKGLGDHSSYEARRNSGKPPEDPQFDIDYTGTSYGVAEIPLETAKRIKVAQ